MKFPIWLTVGAALVAFGAVVIVGQAFIQPDQPLIIAASFTDEIITPNADNDNDVTIFNYELARNARISLLFEAEDGTVYTFRDGNERVARDYSVFFSGVVDGYLLPDETLPGTVERRLLPDGTYTWRFSAENSAESAEVEGTLTVAEGDAPLPIVSVFSLSTPQFTPNQDGVNDRLTINVYLEKADAQVELFLMGEANQRIPITERIEEPGEEQGQRYTFDYAGGVDLGQDPPPDGTYTVVVLAQDDEGQRMRREDQITILRGGKPRAEIAPQAIDTDVIWEVQAWDDAYRNTLEEAGAPLTLPAMPESVGMNQIVVPLGDTLVFRLTVNNYSNVPIRTTGPAPGTVYEQEQPASGLGRYEEPGAWRVGMMCDSSLVSFPYRWAIGTDDVLETIEDPDTGRLFQYLPPNSTATVWGGVRMNEIFEGQNPQTCWMGLIHEQVAISELNRFVSPIEVELVPSSTNVQD